MPNAGHPRRPRVEPTVAPLKYLPKIYTAHYFLYRLLYRAYTQYQRLRTRRVYAAIIIPFS